MVAQNRCLYNVVLDLGSYGFSIDTNLIIHVNNREVCMREIKFRAWDRFKSEMVQCYDIKLYVEFDGTIWENKYNYDGDCLKERTSLALMQYTGLKDKNGKEIYEGDIVIGLATEDFPDNNTTSDIIMSDCYQWSVRSTIDGYDRNEVNHGLPINWGGWQSLEVVGNIYSNPELLQP